MMDKVVTKLLEVKQEEEMLNEIINLIPFFCFCFFGDRLIGQLVPHRYPNISPIQPRNVKHDTSESVTG